MRKQLLTKMLLIAASLFVGTSAWADQTVLNPTETTRLHAGEADAAHYDALATSWTCTISSLTSKRFKDDNASWGGSYVVISKFDASSTLSGKSLTGAKLKFHTQCTASGKNSQVRVWSIGTGWTASTATWNNTNTDEIINGSIFNTTANVGTSGSDIEVDVTSLLRDDADKIVGFGFSTVTGREQQITNLSLEVTYSSEVLYTATFTENNSLTPTVTIYSDEERTSSVINGALADKTTYYYRAVLEGYNNFDGSFTIDGANPSVNFTMTLKPRYTFTVNAVNSVGGAVIQALYTDDDSYDGKMHNVSYPLYLTGVGNAVTYVSTDGSYYKSYTSSSADATKTISFTAYTGEAYFFEGEDVAEATIYTTGTFRPRSSSGATGVLSAATVTSLETGVYRITARSIGKAGNTHSIYKTSTEGEKIFDITTSIFGAIKSEIIILNATTDIVANGGYYTTSDNGHGFDYFLIEKNPTISTTVTSAGWASLYTPYALDFSGTGLTAYTATCAGSTVTLTPVENVPANTGVVLKGAEGNYNIPVIASSSTAKGDLKGSATDAKAYDTDYNYYYLALNGSGNAQFKRLASAGSIAAGKAYLQLPYSAGARDLSVVFEDEATAISSVQLSKDMMQNEYFDLQGRRVAQPTKGLYIVNGKKVVIK